MLSEYEYKKLCDENSEMLLRKIICPCCGHVYSTKGSIDSAFSGDCEDTIRFNCEKCGEELVVKVIVKLVEHFLCVRNSSKHFTCSNLFNLYNFKEGSIITSVLE